MPVPRLPAEWESQDAVLLAWPHEHSDWAPMLGKIEQTIARIAAAVSLFENVLLLVPPGKETRACGMLRKNNVQLSRISCIAIKTNDIWTRDYGPITVYAGKKPVMLNFTFNGWGKKHAAALDNKTTQAIHTRGLFPNACGKKIPMVLEGGSIDCDGAGTILTTTQCLREKNRNPRMSQPAIEKKLKTYLGAGMIHWLNHGGLEGDDTDSHIDTLARFAPNNTICYVRCANRNDRHYAGLRAMEMELRALKTRAGKPYRLMALPFPDPCFNKKGQRLPATYANFLVINNAVLVPTYGQKQNDLAALARIRLAFPGRRIIGVNCLPAVEHGGSLHCLTMQLPKGVIS